MMINYDLPIKSISEDSLKRSAFAQKLASAISQHSSDNSFVIGIYGKWGSGKTSLLNMVFESLKGIDDETVLLRFDPWLFSDSRQLISQFLKQLANAVNCKTHDELWQTLNRYSEVFEEADIIPVAGRLISKAVGTFADVQKAKSEDLQKLKTSLVKEINKSNVKIVISIDDIDRLSTEDIVSVFQLVKSVADFPNTTYLLAFDYNVVTKALESVQKGDGRDYMEKIVQVPFAIPAMAMDSVHNLLFSRLNKILEGVPREQFDDEKWAQASYYAIKKYIDSIRAVNRYTNVFSIAFEMLKNETDPVDLLILTCLQVFEPGVYSKLFVYKDQVCGPSIYSFGRNDWEEKQLNNVVEDLLKRDDVSNYTAASALLSLLFPRLHSVLKEPRSISGYYDDRESRAKKNISNRSCFDRYFQFVLEDIAVTSVQVNDIIFHDDELGIMSKLELLYSNGKIISLIDDISALIYTKDHFSISEDRVELLVNCLARKCGSYEANDGRLFAKAFDFQISYCILDLLSLIRPAMKYSVLRSLFSDNKSHPTVLMHILNTLEQEHGRFTDKAAIDKSTVSLEELHNLEELFADRCKSILESDNTKWDAKELDFIWLLTKIQPNSVDTIRSRINKDDILLAYIISVSTGHGTILSGVQQKTWKFNDEVLSPYIDIKEAYNRITAFLQTKQFKNLPDSIQKDLFAFMLYQESGIKESQDSYSDSILEESVMRKMSEYGV